MWLTDGGNNSTGWHNDEYDRLISEAAPRAKERTQRYAHFRRAEALLLDAMPIIPIYTYNSIHLVHPNVKGLPSNILDYALYKQMYLSEE